MYVCIKKWKDNNSQETQNFLAKKSWIVYTKITSQFATTVFGDSDITH